MEIYGPVTIKLGDLLPAVSVPVLYFLTQAPLFQYDTRIWRRKWDSNSRIQKLLFEAARTENQLRSIPSEAEG